MVIFHNSYVSLLEGIMDIGPLQWNSIVCLACLSVYHGDSSPKCEKKMAVDVHGQAT